MKIAVMIVAKNEERMMPWSLRHYASFADEIVVYDNMSTDSTRTIVSSCPIARIVPYDSGGSLDDFIISGIKSSFATTCDWRIIVDADELVWGMGGMRPYLQRCLADGVTVPSTMGFNMIGDGWPTDDGRTQLTTLVRHGVYERLYSKPCVLHRSIEVSYRIGSHSCAITKGRAVVSPKTDLRVLHYAYIDRDERVRSKALVSATLSDKSRASGHVIQDPAYFQVYYELARRKREEVIPPS